MKKESKAKDRRGILLSLIILGLVSALIILPGQFRSEAINQNKIDKGLVERTVSDDENLPNYDIREQKSDETTEALLKFRDESGKSAFAIADVRDSFVRGEDDLRTRVPSLQIDYNNDIQIPEVIATDVYKANIERLTGPSGGEKNAETLRNFAKQNNQLIGMEDSQLNQLKVVADYTNPSGNMAFAHLEQLINDVPVFRGEIKAGFTTNGEIVRVINNLAPGLDYQSLSTDFGDPLDAVKAAAGQINHKLEPSDTTRNAVASTDLKTVFGVGDWATTAEKMYFPTEVGVARPSWRVLIWEPVNAFYVIVDGKTGTMLWRKNITEDQTSPAKYDIYNDVNGFMKSSRSPYVWTPGPIDPSVPNATTGVPRTTVTTIGNEAPNTFNMNGWITNGGDRTDGNNVQAGVDLVAPDGVDVNGEAIEVTPGMRDFQYTFNPYNPNNGTGDAPTSAAARSGGSTMLFYICNRFHDSMYLLGFNEEARNFQTTNFTGMGIGNDRVSAESQDSSGTNNANFSTPADGGRGRMQMYRWTLAGPGLDGSLDADIVIHEHVHGLSNRLHGNATGLTANMSRMMGEGWSDFYAHTLLSRPSEAFNITNTLSGWATSGLIAGQNSYYYGIRRFPKSPMAFTGGAMNRPHNPITFADVDQTTVNYTDGAFAAPVAGHLSTTADQVHSGGEVWSSALWEVRTQMVTRLGFAAGNQRVLQVVTDGMKMAPLNPDYIQERNAIIAAASALPVAPEAGADVVDVREGFRIRGMGFTAAVNTAGTGGGTARVTEAFDFPNVRTIDPFSVSDSTGDNDGFPEPGENVLLSVAVTNTTGSVISNVMVNAGGQTPVSYGNMADASTITMQIPYTIPGSAGCGSFHTVAINVSSAAGAQAPVNRTFRLGAPVGGPAQTFTNATVIDIPMGQPGTTSGPASPYSSNITVSGLTGPKVISVELTTLNHTWVGDIDILLESPAGQKYIMFSDTYGSSNRTNTVITTLTLRDDAVDTMPATGVPPVSGTFKPTNHGANDLFVAPAPVGPYENAAPGGVATFASVFGSNGAVMNGAWKLWVVDDAGGDPGMMAGWKITFESDDYVCSLAPNTPRADFDGDGKTDFSVFRPSEGNWYLNRSTAGFMVLNLGISTDTIVPGDYDGDGKTDTAVFRPVTAPGTPDFYVLNSNGFTLSGAEWGVVGDKPVVADYDGDGKDDFAVFRDSNTMWYILRSSNGGNTIHQFGASGDLPMAVDNDGDGKANSAVYRPGNNTWYIARPTGTPATNFDAIPMGIAGDLPVPADYTGDRKDNVAMFRPSTGQWFILNAGTTTITQFGASGDIPVPGDYDGDGKYDLAVYRSGNWWVRASTSGNTSVTNFGLGSDRAVPKFYIP